MKSKDDKRTRKKAELILKVNAGLMTATDAAKELGVSRKTYYQWQNRGLEGMLAGLSERKSGRPAEEKDPEKEQLKKTLEKLEDQVQAQAKLLKLRAELTGEVKKKRINEGRW